MDLTVCPKCGEVAEIQRRPVLESTDGPIEHVKTLCIRRHWFLLPVAWLPGPGSRARRPAHDSAQPAESSIGGYTTPALTEGRAGTEPQRHGAHHERAFPRDGGAPSRWNASAREVGGMAFVALSAFWVLLDGETPGLSHGVDVGEDSNGSSRDGRFYEPVRERWCDVQARSKRPGSTRSCPCTCPTPMSVL